MNNTAVVVAVNVSDHDVAPVAAGSRGGGGICVFARHVIPVLIVGEDLSSTQPVCNAIVVAAVKAVVTFGWPRTELLRYVCHP